MRFKTSTRTLGDTMLNNYMGSNNFVLNENQIG